MFVELAKAREDWVLVGIKSGLERARGKAAGSGGLAAVVSRRDKAIGGAAGGGGAREDPRVGMVISVMMERRFSESGFAVILRKTPFYFNFSSKTTTSILRFRKKNCGFRQRFMFFLAKHSNIIKSS